MAGFRQLNFPQALLLLNAPLAAARDVTGPGLASQMVELVARVLAPSAFLAILKQELEGGTWRSGLALLVTIAHFSYLLADSARWGNESVVDGTFTSLPAGVLKAATLGFLAHRLVQVYFHAHRVLAVARLFLALGFVFRCSNGPLSAPVLLLARVRRLAAGHGGRVDELASLDQSSQAARILLAHLDLLVVQLRVGIVLLVLAGFLGLSLFRVGEIPGNDHLVVVSTNILRRNKGRLDLQRAVDGWTCQLGVRRADLGDDALGFEVVARPTLLLLSKFVLLRTGPRVASRACLLVASSFVQYPLELVSVTLAQTSVDSRKLSLLALLNGRDHLHINDGNTFSSRGRKGRVDEVLVAQDRWRVRVTTGHVHVHVIFAVQALARPELLFDRALISRNLGLYVLGLRALVEDAGDGVQLFQVLVEVIRSEGEVGVDLHHGREFPTLERGRLDVRVLFLLWLEEATGDVARFPSLDPGGHLRLSDSVDFVALAGPRHAVRVARADHTVPFEAESGDAATLKPFFTR
mmetsp:Transcript_12633/g.25773  ORF Transcript_12633/g.25773 Transcript_12633/m.25773 type:complete len:523 (+) Transcript_12633:251-1819(+)